MKPRRSMAPVTRAYRDHELARLLAQDEDDGPPTVPRARRELEPTRLLLSLAHDDGATDLRPRPRDAKRVGLRRAAAALGLLVVVVGLALSVLLSAGGTHAVRATKNVPSVPLERDARVPRASPPARASRATPSASAQPNRVAPGTDAATPAPIPTPTPTLGPTSTPAPAAAIDALAAGREREALAAYLALAHAYPERPVFDAIAIILARKIAAHCRRQLEAGGAPCEADPR